MFAQTRLSTLTVEVPEPLAMFTRTKIHPDNVALEKQAHDPRFMPRQQLKQYQRAFKAAEYALERAGMLDYPELIYSLRDRFRQAKMDYLQAEDDHRAELRVAALDAVANYRAAVGALDEPLRWQPTRWEQWRDIPAYAARLASRRVLREMIRLYTGLKARLDEHESALEYRAVRHKLKAELDKEAALFASIIIDRWTQMGHCYSRTVTRNGRSVTKTDKVTFQQITVTEDAIHFKILATTIGFWGRPIQHMPNGVSVTKLLQPDMLIDLSHACEREVTTPHGDLDKINHANGAYLTVHRLSSADGMLKHVPLTECWNEFPRDMAALMPIPVGVRKGKLIHYLPLVKKPHILIAGQTGSGKTNLYNVILATLVKFYSPQDIQLILCDFKEGLGFGKWDGVQHVSIPVITELGDLLNVLKRLERMRHQRTLMMKGLADDLEEYNRRVKPERRLPRVLVIMDEFQQISAHREFRDEIINYVQQLTAKARSAGIHIVPGTQTPMVDQVPGPIKNNMSVVISGRMRTLAASLAAFGSKDALDLANIPGRMSLEDGVNRFQIQVPYCSEGNIKEAQLAAASWPKFKMELPELEEGDVPPLFDQAAMIAYVINHAGGALSTRAVYSYASEFGISRTKLAKMVDAAVASIKANDNVVEFEGKLYVMKRRSKAYVIQSTDDEDGSYPGEAAAD